VREIKDIEDEEFIVNKYLGIDESVNPNQEYHHPFITVVFIDSDKLYVCLFHNTTKTHYHFIYDSNPQAK